MLQLTSKAAQHLIKIRGERGVDDHAAVRFVSNEGRVGVTFTLTPMQGDHVVEGHEVKIFVAPEISATLDESIIDARDEDGRTALVMRKQAAPAATTASPTN